MVEAQVNSNHAPTVAIGRAERRGSPLQRAAPPHDYNADPTIKIG
jgi:hypothetical protein